LEDARGKIRDARERLERNQSEISAKVSKIKDLQDQVIKMKKNSDHLHKIGDTLENELSKTAKATEEHKNKRLTAKHELMTILRKLEAEQGLCKKLNDSIKFTFTPKALSQQQLLQESIVHIETELLNLAKSRNKMLPPSPADVVACMNGEKFGESRIAAVNGNVEGSALNDNSRQGPKLESDSNRHIANLENETKRVSQGIMALMSCVERLRLLITDTGEKSCMTVLTDFLAQAKIKQEQENNRKKDKKKIWFTSRNNLDYRSTTSK